MPTDDGEIVLDAHGSPAHVEAKLWIVCFVPGLRPQWWHRFANRSHKHVFALRLESENRWLLFEPWWTRLMVTTISTKEVLPFLRWASRGNALKVTEAIPGKGSQLRGWMSCAALTAYLLGRGYRVWTPHALFCALKRENHTTVFNTDTLARQLRNELAAHESENNPPTKQHPGTGSDSLQSGEHITNQVIHALNAHR